MADGIVLNGTEIVVPHKRFEATPKLIHEGHLGLDQCKFRTKDTLTLSILKVLHIY